MSQSPPPPSDRTRLRRKADRGHYDRTTIEAILDEALPRRSPNEPEKRSALAAIVDHMEAGRSESSRAPTDAEVRSTLVVRLSLEEASAKIRTGGPVDDDADYALGHWAGVIPLTLTRGEPVADLYRAPPTDPQR